MAGTVAAPRAASGPAAELAARPPLPTPRRRPRRRRETKPAGLVALAAPPRRGSRVEGGARPSRGGRQGAQAGGVGAALARVGALGGLPAGAAAWRRERLQLRREEARARPGRYGGAAGGVSWVAPSCRRCRGAIRVSLSRPRRWDGARSAARERSGCSPARPGCGCAADGPRPLPGITGGRGGMGRYQSRWRRRGCPALGRAVPDVRAGESPSVPPEPLPHAGGEPGTGCTPRAVGSPPMGRGR